MPETLENLSPQSPRNGTPPTVIQKNTQEIVGINYKLDIEYYIMILDLMVFIITLEKCNVVNVVEFPIPNLTCCKVRS